MSGERKETRPKLWSGSQRELIVLAAIHEVGEAGFPELLGFLTPALLADPARSPEREWSSGTVRYQFRREGLAFDRTALGDEMVSRAWCELKDWLDGWSDDSCQRIRAAGTVGVPSELCAALEGWATRVSAAWREDGGWRDFARVLMLGIVVDSAGEGSALARELIGSLRACGGRLVAAFAQGTGFEPPDAAAAETIGLAALLLVTLAGADAAGADLDRELAATADLLRDWIAGSQEQRRPRELRGAERESPDDVVLRIEQELEIVGLSSRRAVGLVDELITALPGSSWAFARGRRKLASILAQPRIRETPHGERLWSTAAEVIAMAEGDRQLAEEAASVTLMNASLRGGRVALSAAIRTGWMLVRLERYEDAQLHLVRVARAARRIGAPDVAALAEAFLAYGLSFAGPLNRSIESAEQIIAAEVIGPDAESAELIAKAAAVRAHLLAGDADRASKVLARPVSDGAVATLGGTMLQISHAWLLIAAGRHVLALQMLSAVRERLRRVHVQNPGGWPWLEPTVLAMALVNRKDEAREMVEQASAHARRWGTPVVLAELLRARAVVADSIRERRRHLSQSLGALDASGAVLERARTQLILNRCDGASSNETDHENEVHRDSPLVAALLPQAPALANISPRVREVIELVASGMRNNEIAAALGIAPATVNRHVSNAMRTTGTRSRTELAILFAGRAGDRPTHDL